MLATAAHAQSGRRGGDETSRFQRAAKEIQRQISAGEYAHAERQARQMLERVRERRGESGAATRLLFLLGKSFWLQGRNDEADAVMAEGVALCQRVRGDDAKLCLGGQVQHANILQKLGRFGEAHASLRQALAWVEALPEGAAGLRIATLNQAAHLYGEMGQYREAEPLLGRALALSEGRSERAMLNARAGTLFFLGRLQMKQKRLEEAERNLREALRLQEALHGAEHRLTARTRFQIGHLLLQQNRPEAVDVLRAATDAFIKRQAERTEAAMSAMSVLALALEAQGRVEEAESWHRRALENARLGGIPASQAHLSRRYGHFLAQQGRLREAADIYRGGVAAAEKLFAQTRGLPEELRHGVIGQFLQMYRELIDLLLRLHQQEPAAGRDREAFSVTALTQSRIFSEMLRQAQVSEYSRSERFRLLKSQRDRLLDRQAAAMQGGETIEAEAIEESDGETQPVAPVPPGTDGRLTESEAALAKTEEALWREFPQYMELVAPRRLDAARIQSQLRPGEAVLSFALLRQRSVVFVMTREQFAAVPLSPGRADVSSRIRDLRAPFETVAAQGDPAGLLGLDPAKLHDFYREMFQPASAHLGGISRLIVIGDGPLYTLPLGMLVERYEEEDRRRFLASRETGSPFGEYASLPYLGDRYRIGYLPSAATLAALRESAASRKRYAEQLVAFADPRFHGKTGSPAPLRGGLAPLPETAEEARRIAGILDSAQTRLLIGEAAQEHAAKQPAMADARYVLFATHGVLGGEFIEEAESAAQQPALALSMAGDLRGEDGWLTMREVMEQVRLEAELIVLSACNTAGGAGGGEGFAGLSRAFMYAGARGLVVSHWAVESAATRDLMVELFRRLRAGSDAVVALAEAQRAVRATSTQTAGRPVSRAHPFFWAPFVFVGD
ncbi:MAG: CHAT domain-containing protein [Rhodocyclales bacterium]|nr:CHAT domain-containing protein [Rhodocyclales bacterium]